MARPHRPGTTRRCTSTYSFLMLVPGVLKDDRNSAKAATLHVNFAEPLLRRSLAKSRDREGSEREREGKRHGVNFEKPTATDRHDKQAKASPVHTSCLVSCVHSTSLAFCFFCSLASFSWSFFTWFRKFSCKMWANEQAEPMTAGPQRCPPACLPLMPQPSACDPAQECDAALASSSAWAFSSR